MTAHCLGTERIAHSSYAVMDHLTSRQTIRPRRTKYLGRPSTAVQRPVKRYLQPISGRSHPLTGTTKRPDIDHLLHDLFPRKAPGVKTVFERYVVFCQHLGRTDIYNRRLARRFIKSIRKS